MDLDDIVKKFDTMLKYRGQRIKHDHPKNLFKDTATMFQVVPLEESEEDEEEAKHNTSNAVLIIFHTKDKVLGKLNSLQVCEVTKDCDQVFIYAKGCSQQGKEILQAQSFKPQFFSASTIAFDKTRSRLVPRYVKLTSAEIVALEASKKCKRTDFPRIRTFDPVGQYLGLSAGDVVHAVDMDGHRYVTE